MKKTLSFILALSIFLQEANSHPGSGIVVDRNGRVYFTDTGKGVWKIDTNNKLIYLPSSRFHWMTIDHSGYFAGSPRSFGEFFERVTADRTKPVLVISSDFPVVMGKDGSLYYIFTRAGQGKIIRRSPAGNESVLLNNKILESATEIAIGPEGSFYFTENSNANANTVRRVAMDGTMSLIATYSSKNSSRTPLDMTASYCRGLTVDPTGNIYVAATGSRSILKITPDGKIRTILEISEPWTATGLFFFGDQLYILEWHDVKREDLEVRTAWIPRVRKLDAGGKLTTLVTVSR